MIRRPLTSIGLRISDVEYMSKCLQQKFKKPEDVLGGPGAWENAEVTEEEQCPKCAHTRAYFMTRNNDESTATFYKCTDANCAHRWKK